jgi:ParB family chromosome partitioning protein
VVTEQTNEGAAPLAGRRGGLGRGLGALIPTAAQAETEPQAAGARLVEVPVTAVEPKPRQPRGVFDEDAMAELVASIKNVGLLQPVVVRELGADRFQLVMGERRWRAAGQAGLETIPAIVRDTDDDDMLRNALLENLHREQLNPLEEAAAYGQLLDDFGATHEQLAQRIGRSRAQVSNTLRLLNLPPAVQRRVAAGVLSAGHARALLTLTDAEAAETLAGRIVAEGLSVRAVEEFVAAGGSDGERKHRRTRSSGPLDRELAELAAELSERLDTRVRLQGSRDRGRIVIDFGSTGDLHRLAGLIGPDGVEGADPVVTAVEDREAAVATEAPPPANSAATPQDH